MKKYYQCISCKKKYPFAKNVFTCENHSQYYGYLSLQYEYKKINISRKEKNLWKKYGDLFPVKNFKVNFNEQKTPLIHLANFGKKLGLGNLYVKDESKNPTGSFKDKENLVAINQALDWGVGKIFVVSSGNAAVSTAAYAKKAGLPCECIVSTDLSVGKRFLINLYGGKLVQKKGNYESIYRSVIDTNHPGYNMTPGYNPVKEEGIKMIGYEIYEDLEAPDVIIVPCGNGTLLFGIYKAFKELNYLGLINKLPKMIGVQIKNASPIKKAFENKVDHKILKNIPYSIAEGIIAEESYSSPKAILALKETGGEIIEVTDRELTGSMKKIISMESLIPEPTSAVVYAALSKMKLNPNDKVVLVQSAGGMKNLKEIMETFLNS